MQLWRTRLRSAGLQVAATGGGGVAPMVTTYQGHDESTTGAASYTTTAAALGTASADRIIIVWLQAASAASQTVSSVTVQGISATRIITAAGAGGTRQLECWYVAVPTGTTGDIVTTFSAAMTRYAVDWWSIVNTTQTTYAARSGANPDINTSGTTISSTAITVPAGGVAIGMCRVGTGTPTTPTLTVTNGSVNTRHSAQIGASGGYDICGDASTAGAGQQFTYTQGGSAVNLQIGAIAWGP